MKRDRPCARAKWQSLHRTATRDAARSVRQGPSRPQHARLAIIDAENKGREEDRCAPSSRASTRRRTASFPRDASDQPYYLVPVRTRNGRADLGRNGKERAEISKTKLREGTPARMTRRRLPGPLAAAVAGRIGQAQRPVESGRHGSRVSAERSRPASRTAVVVLRAEALARRGRCRWRWWSRIGRPRLRLVAPFGAGDVKQSSRRTAARRRPSSARTGRRCS